WCSWLYQGKKRWQKARASSMEPNRSGNSGRYLRVLNWLSEYGLSSETCGRLWVLVMPRSASISATGFGGHRGSAIGVDGQSVCHDGLFLAGCRDQPFGQLGSFASCHHPAHHIAAEDVQDDVEMEIGPLGWAQQLRNIPCPDLIGSGGQ